MIQRVGGYFLSGLFDLLISPPIVPYYVSVIVRVLDRQVDEVLAILMPGDLAVDPNAIV